MDPDGENFQPKTILARIALVLFSAESWRLCQIRGPFLESPDNFSGPESYFMKDATIAAFESEAM